MCMKETSLMLTMLIPGPKSPAKDIDVYLQPLIKELQELWKGVWTKDAAYGDIAKRNLNYREIELIELEDDVETRFIRLGRDATVCLDEETIINSRCSVPHAMTGLNEATWLIQMLGRQLYGLYLTTANTLTLRTTPPEVDADILA
ncbi:hypothetical protein Tco_0307236 [Tanacetum coccineum]